MLQERYPEEEFPWNFYFNGVLMPKWGACWGLAEISQFLKPLEQWDHDVGHRDICLIGYRIDHVGVVESADPGVFIYAVQEVLDILLTHRDRVMKSLIQPPPSSDAVEVYQGLLSAALQMRRLAIEEKTAFWTSGYESDRLHLIERIECSKLSQSDPRYRQPPHSECAAKELGWLIEKQRSKLHALAQSGGLDKELRRELHNL